MTDTKTAVERGNHAENKVVMMFLGSRERRIYGGILIFNDLVIFSNRTGSLASVRDPNSQKLLQTYPLPLPPPVVASYAAQMLSKTN